MRPFAFLDKWLEVQRKEIDYSRHLKILRERPGFENCDYQRHLVARKLTVGKVKYSVNRWHRDTENSGLFLPSA